MPKQPLLIKHALTLRLKLPMNLKFIFNENYVGNLYLNREESEAADAFAASGAREVF
jgi:hypothetical protein